MSPGSFSEPRSDSNPWAASLCVAYAYDSEAPPNHSYNSQAPPMTYPRILFCSTNPRATGPNPGFLYKSTNACSPPQMCACAALEIAASGCNSPGARIHERQNLKWRELLTQIAQAYVPNTPHAGTIAVREGLLPEGLLARPSYQGSAEGGS